MSEPPVTDTGVIRLLMRRATIASLLVASGLGILKLLAWVESDSVTLLSSFLDSLLDTVAAAINLLAVRQALTPADTEHRFGHGKVEPLASLGQAAFIAGSALLLLIEAAQHLIHPVPLQNTGLGLIVTVVAIVVSIGLLLYQRHVVRRTGSMLIGSDALHYAADLGVNVSVILALLLTRWLGSPLIDPLAGAAIALWIIYGAWRVAQQALVHLMDHELPEEARRRIREIALAHPQVQAVHDLRTRAAGPDAFVQIHLEIDGGLTLNEAHRVTDAVEADILAAFPRAEVLIHQDPAGIEEPHQRFSSAG